jgi:hypothetical protein
MTNAETIVLRVTVIGGDPMMAHIAMMRPLHRHRPKAVSEPRRKRVKAYRIVR